MCAPSTSASDISTIFWYRACSRSKDRPEPAPMTWMIDAHSAFFSMSASEDFWTFKILPRMGRMAWNSEFRASFAVRQNQSARKRCVNADLRSFDVPDLADQNDIGILSKNCTQLGGESSTDGLVDRDVIDTVDHILDGIFQRGHIAQRCIDVAKGALQGGGLAGTGRSGGDDHAVVGMQHVFEVPQRLIAHTQRLDVDRRSPRVEQP